MTCASINRVCEIPPRLDLPWTQTRERIDENQAGDQVGIVECDLQRQRAAHRDADDGRIGYRQVSEQIYHVSSQLANGYTTSAAG